MKFMKPSTKYWKIAINIVTMLAAVLFCIFILPRIIVYFMPFVVGGIIALIANPFVRFLEKKIKIVRKAGSAFVICMVIAVVIFLLYIVISLLVEQIIGFSISLPQTWESVSAAIANLSDRFDIYLSKMPLAFREWFATAFDSVSINAANIVQSFWAPMAEATGNFAKNLPLVIIGIIMAILSAYFFIADKEYLLKLLRNNTSPRIVSRWNLVYGTLKDAVGGYFRAQFKIMAVVFSILCAGMAFLGVDYVVLIALLIALLDFLPFFGTGAVLWPWAIIKLAEGDYRMAIGLAVTWSVSQLVRQLIQPKLVGDSIGLEPIPTLFLLYIGFRVGGAVGLIIAVPVGMIILNLYRAGMFSNFVKSVKILLHDMSSFRKIDE